MDPNRMALSGEELFSKYLKEKDGKVFEQLVEMYESDLSSFIYGIVQDYHETKQLTIEAFARLAVGGSRFEGRSSIKTYLFTIGKNLALRHVKKHRRDHHIPLEDVVGVLASDQEDPMYFMEREENRRMLHKALEGLKDEHRAVLILLYFEDMSYEEVAKIMSKSVKQVGDLAYRAKAAMKRKLEADGFTYSS